MRSQWGDARVVKRAGNEMKALWIWWNKGPREKKKVLGDPLICIHTALPLCPLPLCPILWDTALFFSLTWDPWPSASNPLITIKSPPPTFLPTQISFFSSFLLERDWEWKEQDWLLLHSCILGRERTGWGEAESLGGKGAAGAEVSAVIFCCYKTQHLRAVADPTVSFLASQTACLKQNSSAYFGGLLEQREQRVCSALGLLEQTARKGTNLVTECWEMPLE